MNSLLEQLHDIEGLDPASWWPLAMGWWVLMGIGGALVCAAIVYLVLKLAFLRSWKHDTLTRLSSLERDLSDSTARATVIALSEYLRRIALKKYPRKECAGLTGEAWLKWLSERDPKQFDWAEKGVLLIEVPYAPLNAELSSGEIKDLIHAARNWVR